MPENVIEKSSKRILKPIERISDVLFGLIMVLGFTGSLSAANAGVTYKNVDFTTCQFDPDQSKPTVVLAVGVNFWWQFA